MEVKKKIKDMLEAGHPDIAKLLIREFEGQFPRDPDFYYWKAEIGILENKLDEAHRILVEAIGIAHERIGFYEKLAEVYLLMNEQKLAECTLKTAIARTVSHVEQERLRQALTALGEPEAAAASRDRPVVSIIVLAYNHLEYTKRCIESIYRYTSHLSFELITVDNGSSDGTDAYFQALPNGKKVRFLANAGPVNGFNAGMLAAEGMYTACISNDFIVTASWMDNLLACMASDERIGFVSPGANEVSNNQRIECGASEAGEIQSFARSYNVSDSAKWEERVRLLPCVLMVRTEVLYKTGYYDPRFAYGEFADDDISFRIRRAGYKLIFARDTFVYHFGSVTTREDKVKHNSLEVSRSIFVEKYGLDAWDDASMDIHLVQTAAEHLNRPGNETGADPLRILGINSKCGSTPLQLRNALRGAGYLPEPELHYVTDQSQYIEDLRSISGVVRLEPLQGMLPEGDPQGYNVIMLEGGLEGYEPAQSVILRIRALLKKDGLFVFKVRNGTHFTELARILNVPLPNASPRLSGTFLQLQALIELLAGHKLPVQKILFVQDAAHLHYPAVHQRLEKLLQPLEGFNSSLLTVSEMILVAKGV